MSLVFSYCLLVIARKGITNDSKDPSVDTFRSTTLPILKHFGVPSEGLDLKIECRGAPPHGGGEVFLSVPTVRSSLTAVTWIDEGMVKRIRGVTFSTRVSAQFGNTIIHAARGIFNRLLPDVHIFTDHKAGAQAGKSPGYGISLVAETTTGCFISADSAVSYARGDEEGEIEDEEKKELMPPVDVGEQIASILLGEIEQGGVVDSTHQGLLFILCALCPQDLAVGLGYIKGAQLVMFEEKLISWITNDSKDPSVDTFRSTTLPILKHFGVPSEGLDLKIECRGAPPHGGGEVFLSVPTVRSSLTGVTWIDEGMVKRSPGYGISLVAETTTGCFISADSAVSYARGDEEGEIEDEEKKELMPPVDVGEQIASILLGEIEQGGVVDSTHQGLLFILCALCPQDVSKVRVGKLSPYGIETLRNIRDFLGVKFVIKPDPSTGTVILKCVGCGLTNLSRKAS
ncbi:hypothetical protein TEA_001076 [Camellia sinensis var. sinensis]|uniref:RNA 3'-terminal phosphate cyclase domain-containing protein n=1 Tax=Camellia sinensis var. sinensis TaxID=542762 RepID=A0A4S4EWR1_CAMSN|nr:hypothetical protein TEA_001076 [Camellia sinensis var. sinensis]